MPYNPTTIANYYITKYSEVYNFNSRNLAALTYLANGWHTVFSKNGEALIDEPVICHRSAGATFLTLTVNMSTRHYIPFEEKLNNKLGNQKISKEDKELLERVWISYSSYTTERLYQIAFPEDSPCIKAYNEGRGSISTEEVRRHFAERLIQPVVQTVTK